jgi:ABC-type antimicrobial peptide transport system permease subunit
MTEKEETSSPRGKREPEVPPFVTLAWWQVRPTWRLLLVMGVAIVAVVAFVCTVPLYSDVTMTAGLRNALSSPSQSSDFVVSSPSEVLDADAIGKATQSLNTIFGKDLGTLVNPPQFSIQALQYPLMAKTKGLQGKTRYSVTQDVISFISAPMNQASSHVTVLRGRLPQTSNSAIEVALTSESAVRLHVGVGSTLTVQMGFVAKDPSQATLAPPLFMNIPLRVVGIINPTSPDDSFWHNSTFLSYNNSPNAPGAPAGSTFTGLTSSDGYLNYFSQLFSISTISRYKFQSSNTLVWYCSFNTSAIAIYDLNSISDDISLVQLDVSEDRILDNSPVLEQETFLAPSDIVQRFSAQVPVVSIPTSGLLLVVEGLVMFFVSLMSGILIDRQSETIALLRSRGASRRQIFGVFATQSLGLGVIGLLLGPLLALGMVWFIVFFTLSPTDRGAVDILFNHFAVALVRLGWYPLLTALVAVSTSVIAIMQRVSSTILSLRWETARTTQRPLWQRLNLDLLAAVVAVVGFVILEYLLNADFITTKLSLLLLTPLTLLSILFLALAGILLFLRLYPLLLQIGARLTVRRRGAAPMLALAQMARAPRQSARLTLLLTLATACLLFLFIFQASQSQRLTDVAAYQTGADFSGNLQDSSFTEVDLSHLTSQYRHVQGVLSASLGYVTTASVIGNDTYQLQMQINAVDSNTFSQTAIWTEQNAAQPLPALMRQFIAQRKAAIASSVIPAVVDEAMWNALQLTPGAQFTLIFNGGDVVDGRVNFVAVAEVNHIPTIDDSTVASGTDNTTGAGGMMVDYQTFAQVYIHDFSALGTTVPINYAWLKTRGDDATLQYVHQILSNPKGCCLQLANMYDRRAIVASLQSDPLYLDIIGLLGMGALITVFLLLLGNLIAFWWNVRNRLAQFTVLHALGATSRQVTSILVWEQSISYVTGIVLGLLFGFLLAMFLLPSLVYTGVVSSGGGSDLSIGQFYIVQHVPPIQVVLPPWLFLLLIILLLIFALTLIVMVRVVTKLSPAQTLRLNVD